MALHTRWQFFFQPGQRWDDDNRQVGEHPRPFDEHSLDLVRNVLGIQPTIRRGESPPDMSDIAVDIRRQGASIVQVDRHSLNMPAAAGYRRHLLTTVLLTEIDPVHRQIQVWDPFGDDGTPSWGWVGFDDLSAARSGGFHGRTAGWWRLQLRPLPPPTQGAVHAAAHLRGECERFLRGSHSNNLHHGVRAMRLLADALAASSDDQAPDWFDRLTDWGRHLQFVQMQRERFLSGLTELSQELGAAPHAQRWTQPMQQLTDRWQRVRMVMFLSSRRQQRKMARYLSQTVGGLADEETAIVSDILDWLRGCCLD